MNERLLTERQAYDAMFYFLVELQRQTNSDDLAGLLGDIVINKWDNMPMDPAMWSDWLEAINKALI